MIAVKKAVERAYSLLFPDYGAEITENFRFKLFIVLISLLMFSSAVFTLLFLQK
jgi:hypothetical protein